jgi:hypothetical protein
MIAIHTHMRRCMYTYVCALVCMYVYTRVGAGV